MLASCDKKPDCQLSHQDFKNQVFGFMYDRKLSGTLQLRLDLIDSFLQLQAGSPPSIMIQSYFAVGDVVLIDLTDPFLDGELFSVVIGRI